MTKESKATYPGRAPYLNVNLEILAKNAVINNVH